MARIHLPTNLEEVSADQEFKIAPPGTYTMEVETIEEKLSQKSQPYLNVKCQIIDDPEFTGVRVFESISLQQQALFKLKQLSLATGIDIGEEFDTEEFLGARFNAILDVEDYTNKEGEPKQRNIIKKYEY